MLPLQPDNSYHIFNHANGFENIFIHEANYRYFLEKYRLYIESVAETYACCLMPNHFHLVIRIRKKEVIEDEICKARNIKTGLPNLSQSSLAQQGENFGRGLKTGDEANFGKGFDNKEIEKYLSKQFSKLFSCYTQSFNKVYKRMGSLFIKNFKRELITDKTHFLNTVAYVHRNPIHHGFCKKFDDWPYSSYRHVATNAPFELKIETSKLIRMASGREALLLLHQNSLESFNNSDRYFDLPNI